MADAEGQAEQVQQHLPESGVGGVGGFVCEALARSGIGALDLIDNDRIALSNLNRQIIATMDSLLKGKLSPGEPEPTPKKGPFMMTGTWSHAFLTESDSVRTPIHDKRIVEKIATTEEAVRNTLGN